MATSIPTLLHSVCSHRDDERVVEVDQLAAALGVSSRTARACCRRLRALVRALDAANDGATPPPDDPAARWLSTARLGARLLTVEAGASVAAAATLILASLDGASPANERRVSDVALRALVVRAVTERRVLSIVYEGTDGGAATTREIEPLTLSNIDGHWTALAFCRTRMDLRSFRFDRILDARVTEAHFEARQGMSLERFIHKQKNLSRRRSLVAPLAR
jgi:predicted DNA-binding transcriptional regulator YafY